MKIKQFIEIEKKPHRGLFAMEWAVLAYLLFTLVYVLFAYTKLANPQALIWDRVRVGMVTLAVWAVYELVPCRLTRLLRVLVQLVLLAWWYPDTYELNRILPNLDHVFAAADQALFGCQPALLFSQHFPQIWVSELMDMGYVSYYLFLVVVMIYYFFCNYKEFERAAFILLGSFFAFYVIFDLVPVVGPTFYYKAVGVKTVAAGIFPNVGDYFNTHQDCLPAPGYHDGIFYNIVEAAKASGERPTAAFPSSHVGVATLCMLLVAYGRGRRLLLVLLPFYVFLCMATVYIQAHYAVDALAGFVTGVAFFFLGLWITRKMPNFAS
jgi:membrane-associated phospholipid phosphatase